MPSWASVRRTDSDDCSTSRIISASRPRGTSCIGFPIGQHAFFEQAVLQQQLGQQFLELTRLRLDRLDLVAGRFARSVARQPLLAGLKQVLGPAVIEILADPFLAAQLGDTVLAAQSGNPIR